MKTCRELPPDYYRKMTLCLESDRKLGLLLSAGSVLLAAGLVLLGLGLHPVEPAELAEMPVRWVVCAVGLLLYSFLRGLIHGGLIRLLAAVAPEYGFRGGLFGACCRNAYFSRAAYVLIGFSPVVLIGLALLVLNLVLPEIWFWPVYVIQIFNLGGASGMYFTVWVTLRKNLKGALIRDTGTETEYYLPRNDKKHPQR